MLTYRRIVCILFILTIVLLWKLLLITKNKNAFLIPNIVHYILFNKNTIDYVMYLSIISVLKIQKPQELFIHSNEKHFTGYYWEKLQRIKMNTTISLSYLELPTHTYGQLLSSIYHASDVARIHILKTYGGIYLDTDVLVLNNMDKLRYYEMVVGWPQNESIGNQVILAEKNAKFLSLWQKGYKHYHAREWYYNAGKYPTEILLKQPKFAYFEKDLMGVQYLLDKLHSVDQWDDWKNFYTIHLLSRHYIVTKNLNETSLNNLNTNFKRIVEYILQ